MRTSKDALMLLSRDRSHFNLPGGISLKSGRTRSQIRRSFLRFPGMNCVPHPKWKLAAACLLVSVGSIGCFAKNDALRPQASNDIYRSPVRSDPNRVGDYRRESFQPANASLVNSSSVRLTRASEPTGSTVFVGAVVAEVNGVPIYAHDLLEQVIPALRPRARDLDQKSFEKLATQELRRQRENLIANELVYAAAQRATTLDEQERAKLITNVIYEKYVSAAGGSRELARQKAREEGRDFDDLIKDEYRKTLVSIYYQKHFMPRALISVDEMRQFYARNRDKDFTQKASIEFRLIRVDPRQIGNIDEARRRIEDARQRALDGEDFETLAREVNKDQFLIDSAGLTGPLGKGSYRYSKVEEALWLLDAGQISPIIEDEGVLFLAKVVERKLDRVLPFEDPKVQQQIENALRSVKMLELQQRDNEMLRAEALVVDTPEMLQPVIDMAMQMYGSWTVADADSN